MVLQPLALVDKAYQDGILDKKMYAKIIDRFRYVKEGIARIERASNIKYPDYYIEPNMILSVSSLDEFGILFARTLPVIIDNKVRIIIQLTAPLVAFGLKGTIHAILAHEFLHYLELLSRIIRMEIISDEIANTLFESEYSDLTRLLEAKAVFNDRSLLRLLSKKFIDGLNDKRLEEKSIKLWLEKGYPSKKISITDNITRLSMNAIINTPIDKELEHKINDILKKSEKFKR
ncbi:MAG: hypothetical protein KatS3mg003_0853 [Candidatus Nitrosocaldaceae archaeon]|nr:MAG: hypothetical protein KatS3mg003_0853 [Candidatus Nitrosocaldaceae archaeon]